MTSWRLSTILFVTLLEYGIFSKDLANEKIKTNEEERVDIQCIKCNERTSQCGDTRPAMLRQGVIRLHRPDSL